MISLPFPLGADKLNGVFKFLVLNNIFNSSVQLFMSSLYSAGNSAPKLFDRNPGTVSCTNSTPNKNIGVFFKNSQFFITAYAIQNSPVSAQGIASWAFEGSNDGSFWTILHSNANKDVCGDSKVSSFSIAQPSSFAMFRLRSTGFRCGFDNYHLDFAELEFFGVLQIFSESKRSQRCLSSRGFFLFLILSFEIIVFPNSSDFERTNIFF
jgi:hypothetical protein